MKKLAVIIIAVLLLTCPARAQEKPSQGFSPASLYTLSWTMGVPAGGFEDFINNISFAGGTLAGRYFLKKGFALGFEFGWSSYYRKYPRETYYSGDGTAITAIQYSYALVVPWKVGAYYYFIPKALADPYLGLSLGGDYMEEHILVQEFDVYNIQWGFTLSPEAGVLVKLGKDSNWGASISAQYWFNTNEFSFTGGKSYSRMQGLNFSAGLTYMLR